MMGNCQIWYLVAALPWLLFVYASAIYLGYSTRFVEKIRSEKPAVWEKMYNNGYWVGRPFWVIVGGIDDKNLDPEYLRLVRKPRAFAIFCLLMFASGIFTLALVPQGCF